MATPVTTLHFPGPGRNSVAEVIADPAATGVRRARPHRIKPHKLLHWASRASAVGTPRYRHTGSRGVTEREREREREAGETQECRLLKSRVSLGPGRARKTPQVLLKQWKESFSVATADSSRWSTYSCKSPRYPTASLATRPPLTHVGLPGSGGQATSAVPCWT